jgi:hypothetical protein
MADPDIYLFSALEVGETTPGNLRCRSDADNPEVAGGAVEELVVDGGMEIWSSSTNLTNWEEALGGTSTINREDSVIHGGSYSCRYDIDAGGTFIEMYQGINIPVNTPCTLSFWYKTTGDALCGWILIADVSWIGLRANGTWAGTETNDIPPSPDGWTKIIIPFTSHSSDTHYWLKPRAGVAASESIYFDDISLTMSVSSGAAWIPKVIMVM